MVFVTAGFVLEQRGVPYTVQRVPATCTCKRRWNNDLIQWAESRVTLAAAHYCP